MTLPLRNRNHSTHLLMIKKPYNGYTILVLVIIIFFLLFSCYKPIFETNDDIFMAMITHGYGLALTPSENIMFSNVIYGWILTHLPFIGKFHPYFYMTFFALLVASWALLYFLEVLSISRIYSIVFLLLILIRPIAMPQFTVNSGLLAISAVTGFLAYQKTSRNLCLLLAMGLAFYSFLIRSEELYLIILIAIPLWWNKTLVNQKLIFIFLGFIILCILAKYIDSYAYSKPEFAHYNALAKVRVQFNDFGAATYFAAYPKLLAQYGYTINDLKLVSKFIFIDNQIVNPQRLGALLTHFEVNKRLYMNKALALQALRSIYDPSFRILLATAVITTLLGNNKLRFILCWSIFIVTIVFLGLMGRPSILRVYYPVIAMLAFLPIIYMGVRTKLFFILSITLLALTLYTNYLINQQRLLTAYAAYEDILKLDLDKIYYIRGDALPYQYIDLPGRSFPAGYKLYAFGSSYYLPNTLSNQCAFGEQGFGSRLKSGQPFKMIDGLSGNNMIEAINQYCQEHFERTLKIMDIQALKTFNVYTIRCS